MTQRLHYLCQRCFDHYADQVKGEVALAIEFEGEQPHTCVCGEPVQAGSAFAVRAEHYDRAMEAAPAAPPLSLVSQSPVLEDALKPKLVYQNQELRVVIDHDSFVMEIARLDAMKEIAWEGKTTCRVTGLDIDSRSGRAIVQLMEELEKMRSAASVLCGAHLGVTQKRCPVCVLEDREQEELASR